MARILVIDDDPSILQLMMRMLSVEGHEPLGASDGEIGLQEYEKHEVDLIVTDWDMPRKNGGDVIREVRGQDPAARILLVTADTSAALTARLELGVKKTVAKPFGLQEFMDGVNEVLGQDRSNS